MSNHAQINDDHATAVNFTTSDTAHFNDMRPRINIATALNSLYMRYTYVMLTSLFTNQTGADIHVYLLHSDLSDEEQECLQSLAQSYGHTIHYLHIDRKSFPVELPTTQMWSLESYYRLVLLDILPAEVDRLLYFDVDMIINKPILDLYKTDFEGSYFCACKDMTVSFPMSDIRDEIFKEHIAAGFTYFNSGLMLWNVAALRGKYSFKDYMELAEELEYKMLAPDQDLLNYMHWDQIKFVDEYRYNLFSRMAYANGVRYEQAREEAVIVHYAGMKPWQGQYIHYDIEKLWWDYAKQTIFYMELMEEFQQACLGDPWVYDKVKVLSEGITKSQALCKQLAQMLEQNRN